MPLRMRLRLLLRALLLVTVILVMAMCAHLVDLMRIPQTSRPPPRHQGLHAGARRPPHPLRHRGPRSGLERQGAGAVGVPRRRQHRLGERHQGRRHRGAEQVLARTFADNRRGQGADVRSPRGRLGRSGQDLRARRGGLARSTLAPLSTLPPYRMP